MVYFKGCGFLGEIVKIFGLGYVFEGWCSLVSVFFDYSDVLLVEFGMVIVYEDEKG